MNFYYSADENMCADEQWVAEYLNKLYPEISIENHIEGLQTRQLGYFDWHPCAVCNTIWKAFGYKGKGLN